MFQIQLTLVVSMAVLLVQCLNEGAQDQEESELFLRRLIAGLAGRGRGYGGYGGNGGYGRNGYGGYGNQGYGGYGR